MIKCFIAIPLTYVVGRLFLWPFGTSKKIRFSGVFPKKRKNRGIGLVRGEGLIASILMSG